MSSRKTWVACGAVIFIAAVCAGVLAGWWAFHNVDARLSLANQPVTVRIAGEVPATAKILDNLDIALDTKLKTKVPIDQVIHVPVRDTLHVQVHFDHDVPIVMTVPIKATIPVDQKVHLDTQVTVTVLGVPVTLPVRGDVPIQTTIPLDIKVPVNQQVHLTFTAPADVTLKQPLTVPLKTTIDTTIPIHSTMSVPVRSALKAVVKLPEPIHAVITQADLNLPLHSLRLHLAGDDADQTAAAPVSATPSGSAAQ